MTNQRYDLEEKLLEFSVRIIKIVEQLPNTSIKTAVRQAHGPERSRRAEKKKRNSHSRFGVGFLKTNAIKLRSEATSLFDVRRSMFDVGRSSFKTTLNGEP